VNDVNKLPNRTEVVCVEHDGAHAGVIVHDLGFNYAVAWSGLNVDPEVGRAHGKDAMGVEYDAVREAPHQLEA
jgi:hypothetical protein